MIGYLTEMDKLKCRDLWEEAFPEDSRQFCDYYFREKIKDNRILAIVEKAEPETAGESDRVEAMVQLNPYELMVKGHCWQINYLVGVATRKEKRHQGYMRRLLQQMFADLRRENAPFCFLMPAKEEIYRPFGFTYIFRQPQFSLKEDPLLLRKQISKYNPNGDPIFDQELLSVAVCWMEQWMSHRYQVYARRSPAYLQRLIAELASENGILDLLYDQNQIAGIQGQWGLTRKEQRLLYGEESYIKERKEPKPAIMARIISPEAFVRIICLSDNAAADNRERIVFLHLSDPLITGNDGDWLWHLNQEGSWLERASGKPHGELRNLQNLPTLSLTIEQMTSWLFGYDIPEPAIPYADLVMPLEGIFLDEVV